MSTMISFTDELRALVGENALEDVIGRLRSFLAGGERTLYNECLGHEGRYKHLRQQWRRGEITLEQHAAGQSRLRSSILDFIDEVERVSQRHPVPHPRAPITPRWPPTVNFEVIVGDDRLQSVAWLHQALEAARSVCRISTPKGLGSGFVILGGHIITNYHVLPSPEQARVATVDFNFELDLHGNFRELSTYELDPDTWRGDEELDCVAVQIKSGRAAAQPFSSWGALEWASKNAAPKVGDYVSIIQHPEGGPKRVALSENVVMNVYEHRLQYTTDTRPGSSGSPVFDDAWRVVAVHHAGGNLATDPLGHKCYINEGLLAKYVVEALKLS